MAECRTPDYRDRGSNSCAGISVVRYLYSYRVETWAISFALYRLLLPNRTGQRGRAGQLHQHGKHYKAMAPRPQRHRDVWDVIVIGEVKRREECFTTLQCGHLLHHSKANNSQAGVGVLRNKKWNVFCA